MAKIRAVSPRVGADSAAKSEAIGEPIAVALAMKTGRPVRIAAQREEDMTAMLSRHPSEPASEPGAKRDGTFVRRAIETWFDGGAIADDTAR